MKKLLALFCVLALLAALPCAALADGTVYTEGTLYYTVGNESITIVGCFGKKTEITVPASIAGYPVNTIASGAFTGNKYLKTLYLPDTIMTIEPGAIGPDIGVIYNANTEYPSLVPTGLILGTLPNPAGSETEESPAPTQTEQPTSAPESTPEQTPSPSPSPISVIGSGESDISDDATPHSAAPNTASVPESSETAISEADENIEAIEEEAAAPTPAPTPSSEPAPAAAQEPAAEPEPLTEAEPEPASSARVMLTLIPLVLALAAAAIVLLLRKKKGGGK